MTTEIEWTDESWNPCVSGCSMISHGCEHCYAMKQAHRFSGPTGHARYRGLTVLGKQGPRWTGEVRIDSSNLADPLGWKKPRRVFVNSMSDLFHEKVPDETIAAVFGVMAAAPQHTFQVLTKRAERLPAWFKWLGERDPGRTCGDHAEAQGAPVYVKGRDGRSPWNDYACVWPLPNVWLGVSTEDQETFDERWAHLRRVPAALRWFSIEPQLGPIDARYALSPRAIRDGFRQVTATFPPAAWPTPEHLGAPSADWFVVGGESGPGARPFDVAWGRSIVGQCRAAEVPVFVKQLGANPTEGYRDPGNYGPMIRLRSRKGGDPSEWPAGDWPREFPR